MQEINGWRDKIKKFIKIENTLLNIDNIESVSNNMEITRYGQEWFDENEYEVCGILVRMKSNDLHIFKSVTLDKFMEMVDE